MPDFLVTLMSGPWSVLVYEPGQPDAQTAANDALTNLSRQITGLALGNVLQYVPPPGEAITPGVSTDYLVTLTKGGFSIQLYVEGQPDSATAGNAALANLQQKITRPAVSGSVLFSPSPITQAQLALVM